MLDMHFTVEIARFAGYPSRHVHQIASDIMSRAIRTFSARGIVQRFASLIYCLIFYPFVPPATNVSFLAVFCQRMSGLWKLQKEQ